MSAQRLEQNGRNRSTTGLAQIAQALCFGVRGCASVDMDRMWERWVGIETGSVLQEGDAWLAAPASQAFTMGDCLRPD